MIYLKPEDEINATLAIDAARQRGRRDAAQQQDAASNPYDFKSQPQEHDAWVSGAASVHANRKEGRDFGSHRAPPPHVCIADPTKVCNCCSSCTELCALEAEVRNPRPKQKPQPPTMLARAAWALVRIAIALEVQGIVDEKFEERTNPCSTCGTFVGKAAKCAVCGAE